MPAGLRLRSVEPFDLWSRDLGTFPSPEGTNEVRIIVEIPAKLSEHGLTNWYLEDGWLRRKYNTDGWPTTPK